VLEVLRKKLQRFNVEVLVGIPLRAQKLVAHPVKMEHNPLVSCREDRVVKPREVFSRSKVGIYVVALFIHSLKIPHLFIPLGEIDERRLLHRKTPNICELLTSFLKTHACT